jgi:hypothetical protein
VLCEVFWPWGVTGMPRVYAMQVVWFETSRLCG